MGVQGPTASPTDVFSLGNSSDMNFSLPLFGIGVVGVLLQIVAAIPWFVAVNWESFRRPTSGPSRGSKSAGSLVGMFLLIALGAAIVVPAILATGLVQDRDGLQLVGRLFASILHLQLLADGLILFFALVLLLWPKGGAV